MEKEAINNEDMAVFLEETQDMIGSLETDILKLEANPEDKRWGLLTLFGF